MLEFGVGEGGLVLGAQLGGEFDVDFLVQVFGGRFLVGMIVNDVDFLLDDALKRLVLGNFLRNFRGNGAGEFVLFDFFLIDM